jgi:three-Cys-motif partner protein
MADEFDTIWEAEKHTLAKHLILTSYLGAWTAIMARRVGNRHSEIRVFDAFAGPGIYKGGEKGSPILAVETVLTHKVALPTPVRFTFVEDDPDRFTSLEAQIERLKPEFEKCASIKSVRAFRGNCVDQISKWIDKLEAAQKPLGPAFFFFDQFGYSQVPLTLISRIMKHEMCECFIFINWSRLAPYIRDQTKWPALSRAFGGDSWKNVLSSPPGTAMPLFQEMYKNALRGGANINHVWHFGMCDENEKLTHWLFFCTNNLRGLEEMKKAMRKADPTGGFAFSDSNSTGQNFLFSAYDEVALQQDIIKKFKGTTVSVADIRKFVLTETPAHTFKTTLKAMKGKHLEIVFSPPGKEKGFDEKTVVKFI